VWLQFCDAGVSETSEYASRGTRGPLYSFSAAAVVLDDQARAVFFIPSSHVPYYGYKYSL